MTLPFSVAIKKMVSYSLKKLYRYHEKSRAYIRPRNCQYVFVGIEAGMGIVGIIVVMGGSM